MGDYKILKIAKFVRRLYKLVTDTSYPEIQWKEDGKSFFISNKELFLKRGLKTLSKTSEYSAFVRQLYLYGFSKSKSINAVEDEYYHRNFQKGGEEMLHCINRITDKNTQLVKQEFKGKTPNQLQDLLHYLNSKNYKLENDLKSLQDRVDKQECTINGLVEILSRMFRGNSDQNISRSNITLKESHNNILNESHNNILKDSHNNILNESLNFENYLQNYQLNTPKEKSNFLYSSDEEDSDSFYKRDIF